VREDRRGQDNARNAGLAVASGDIVAFTDDDCVPAPDWLAHVAENFADPLVAVSTGPGFPWALDTAAQERIERQGGFMRGLDRREYDWRTLSPIHAGAAGAGANMMIRRSTLAGLPSPWPPELGPGTPTESGDDTYVLSRFLAAGYRIVYDPRQWFQHQHRADWAALRKAVGGYGVGSMCMLLKSLIEDGETEAPQGLSWIVRQYLRTQRRRLLGQGGRRRDRHRGGLRARCRGRSGALARLPPRLRRSRRTADRAGPPVAAGRAGCGHRPAARSRACPPTSAWSWPSRRPSILDHASGPFSPATPPRER
jgi:glycosyltransferase involved in cell wall biosynthesis